MLSLDLLRTTVRRGNILPQFCSLDFGNGSEYELANKLITYFENSCKDGDNNNTKGILLEKTASLESEYDHKLVRGLFTLLERRSEFANKVKNVDPVTIRRELFEESSSRGFAITTQLRQEIINHVAKKFKVSADIINEAMWSDREENLILEKFESITPRELLVLYNRSLAQTLLFRCTTLEFYVRGGVYWKHVLRNVKRFGLMYHLQHTKVSENGDPESITCTLEGPLSLFKMTDRYGTAMAKLLPWIIKAPSWRISGSVIRKNEDGQKIYQFTISDKEMKDVLSMSESQREDNSSNLGSKKQKFEKDEGTDSNYDSILEEKFEKAFIQRFDKKDDWKISREPDPLIADGKAMIPDFVFERFGRKVYFEIVGFWTKQYLENKAAKLQSIFGANSNSNKNYTKTNNGKENKNQEDVSLLVAVNSELACSQIESISSDNIFTFKKEVPIKPVLQYLRKLDEEIVKENISSTKIQLEKELDIISVQNISKDYRIPVESALKILSTDYPEHIPINKTHLISKKKIEETKKQIEGISKFVDACKILESNDIPEICHAEFLSELGYDVTWNDLNPDNATITEKNSQ